MALKLELIAVMMKQPGAQTRGMIDSRFLGVEDGKADVLHNVIEDMVIAPPVRFDVARERLLRFWVLFILRFDLRAKWRLVCRLQIFGIEVANWKGCHRLIKRSAIDTGELGGWSRRYPVELWGYWF